MKAVKEIVRKYYKYIYSTWEQPIATSDITQIDGGEMIFTSSSSYSGRPAYMAFDGVTSGTSGAWGLNNQKNGWWQIKLPYKILVKGIKHYNNYNSTSDRSLTSARFYTNSDMTSSIGDSFSTPNTNWYETTVQNIQAEGVYTDTIYFSCYSTSGYGGIGEIILTAQKVETIESTSEDYDFYKDVVVYKISKINETFYGIKQ